jgi:signal transduction histidine kinase
LPLRRGGEVVATLGLYADDCGAFAGPMRELLVQVAENVSFALDGFAAEDRLREVAAQRSELLTRLVTAQEEERARIAADVHDESVQALAAMDLRLGMLERHLREGAPDLLPELGHVQQTLHGVVGGLRELLFELEPHAGAATCAEAVQESAEHVFERSPVAWQLRCDDEVHLGGIEQLQALRIVKEALINVRKHARADRVEITVTNADDGVHVDITDDGVGLRDGDGQARPGHRGLQTMRDRAAVAGGWCRIGPAPDGGGGTSVRFWLPRTSPD